MEDLTVVTWTARVALVPAQSRFFSFIVLVWYLLFFSGVTHGLNSTFWTKGKEGFDLRSSVTEALTLNIFQRSAKANNCLLSSFFFIFFFFLHQLNWTIFFSLPCLGSGKEIIG